MNFRLIPAAISGTLLAAFAVHSTPLRAQNIPMEFPAVETASASDTAQDPPAPKPNGDGNSSTIESPKPQTSSDAAQGKQTKRILWIIPNYRAVSVNSHLPPLSVKDKFWLATQDSFDYSNFIFVGMLSGVALANNSEPQFQEGAAGYGRYYWHVFVDTTIGNYMTEGILPTLTREDPRYYTLGKGGLFKRTGYAVSRLFITRTDGGHSTFNISEIVGNGAAAGIGNAYYPQNQNHLVKTYQRWGTQIALDGAGNVLKEFWPEINHAIFHGKY